MFGRLLTEHDHIRKTLNLLEIQFLDLCRNKTPDYSIMRSIVVYVQEYPEQAHHPLEDAIFSILSERVDDPRLLQSLMADHTELEAISRKLRETLASVNSGTNSTLELKQQLEDFIVRQRYHLYFEEKKIYPIIKYLMTEEDWQHVQSIVPLMDDPVFGERSNNDYELLYRELEGNKK